MATDELALKVPFSIDKFGNVITTTSQTQIWTDRVISAIGTQIGERVMRPSYGTRTAKAAFETITSAEEIVKREIDRVFHEQLPLLTLENVEFSFDQLTNTLNARVIYLLPNKEQTDVEIGTVTLTGTTQPYEERA